VSGRFLIFAVLGLAVIAAAIFVIFSSTKGAHLELQGKILKVRTGALDDQNSIAVLDFRIEDVADVPFVVREVNISLDKSDGSKLEGALVSKSDVQQLFAYNRFLGSPYNEILSIRDKIAPHSRTDRMAAARFELPEAQLESAKAIRLHLQDMDGPEFETTSSVK
jgi:hypothetical protein